MGWGEPGAVVAGAYLGVEARKESVLRGVIYSLILCTLAACGGGGYRAPVENRQTKPKPLTNASVYYVQRGDTLYSIAWRFGLDYKTLAAANNIPSPHTIYPGQKISLNKKAAPARSSTPAAKPKPAPAKASAPAVATATKVKVSPAISKPKSAPTPNVAVSGWRWPTSGKVSRGYSSTVHKGIDINGNKGDPIYAVAGGTVVYAGTGIVGFGELLIIKHNDTYLSAYGHNNRLLVAEGVAVKSGQRIAEKGSSGTDVVKLHFEIRKKGKPIDPQKLLPRR